MLAFYSNLDIAGSLRRRRAVSTAVFIAVVLAILLAASDAGACPMCKAALGSQGRNHGDWVGGFFWSILFMLSMPFLILGGLSAYMYRLVRQARRTARRGEVGWAERSGSHLLADTTHKR